MEHRADALEKGMRQIEGLHFQESPIFQSPLEIYKALLSHTGSVPEDQIPETLVTSLFGFIEICIQFVEAWERDLTRAAHYSLVQTFWDSPHLLHIQDIRDILVCIHGARVAYKTKNPKAPYPADPAVYSLISHIDHMIKHMRTHDYGDKDGPILFPHAFGSFDLAVLGEPRVRSMVFPNRASSDTTANDIDNYYAALDKGAYTINPFVLRAEYKLDQYPTKQTDPLNTRAYLCRLALATGVYKRYPLFLTPIAFITHSERRSWDLLTAKLSRYYATVEDFLYYFEDFATGTRNTFQDHALALVTPWFHNIETASQMAIGERAPIWDTWEKKCHRTGFVFILSRLNTRTDAQSRACRLLIIQPATGEASYMADAQDTWIADVIDYIKGSRYMKELREIWVKGRTRRNGNKPSRKIKVSLKGQVRIDSVATSAEFLEKAMTFAFKIPEDHDELLANKFERIYGQENEANGA
ncbi:hypothetical protein GGR51DRAFT_573355 [Nemania sp. FL0031]|nr:hypothetical protein GGR51DRAFT_573355 [Nemania sp. FL0031]